jgi:hypothetical protein
MLLSTIRLASRDRQSFVRMAFLVVPPNHLVLASLRSSCADSRCDLELGEIPGLGHPQKRWIAASRMADH